LKLFDVFLFFNELDLLELRLNTLYDVVDFFVISEATVTFSGHPKPLIFAENAKRFERFSDKIIYNLVDSTPISFVNFVPPNEYFTKRDVSYSHKSSGVPLKQLSMDFQREVFQRDSAINGLLGRAKAGDLIMISDLDEIPNPKAVKEAVSIYKSGAICTFSQRWYMYFFNVISDREWFGTRICDFETLSGKSIDLIRYHLENRDMQPGPIIENGGWHFSFLGGQERVREKLKAYSYQGRRSQIFLRFIDAIFPSRIARKIEKNQDIFSTGRVFKTVPIDDSFPSYLRENISRFQHLVKK